MTPTTVRSTADTAGPSEVALPTSIKVLRRLNGLLATVLRTPLHGLLSRDLLLLTYTGRKTGVRRTLPLSYVELDGRLYLCTRTSLWWRNLRGGARIELRLRGRRRPASCRVVDPRSAEALDALRAFLTRNPRTGEILYAVRRGEGGRPREDDLAREVVRSIVVCVELDAAAR